MFRFNCLKYIGPVGRQVFVLVLMTPQTIIYSMKNLDSHGKSRNGHGKVMGKKMQTLLEPCNGLFS